MYGQFFGSFLLNVKAVTPQQLSAAITDMGKSHIRLGTLAMYKGYMTSDEVDECCFIQRREDKKFGTIALDRHYLFEDQLEDLLESQTPDYLRLGQTLVDAGVLTNAQLHDLLVMYNDENNYNENIETSDSEPLSEQATVEIRNFFKHFDHQVSEATIIYMHLLLNNLVRFIGNDFTPLAPIEPDEYHTNYCIMQRIVGEDKTYISRVDMDPDAAIVFASRYADMEFDEFDDYVSASLEDFLNLHNGLFCVNMSNMHSVEMSLDIPTHEEDIPVEMPSPSLAVPVIYPFGTIYLLLSRTNP